MKIKLFILSILISSACFSQKAYLDSLWKIWSDNSESDTNRLKAMYDFAWDGYLFTQPDSSYYFSKKMYDFASEIGNTEFQAKALNIQFNYFFGKGDIAKAVEKNAQALKLREKVSDKLGMAVCASNSGILYQVQGDFSNAIDQYVLSLKYNEEIDNKSGVGTCLHNIGHLYQEQKNYEKAVEYYNRSLKIREEINDIYGLANLFVNLGSVYFDIKEYKKSMNFNLQGLKLNEKIENKNGIAGALGNIGMIYQEERDYSKAIEFFTKSLNIQKEIGQKQTMAISILNIGSIYFEQKDYVNAHKYCAEALQLSEEIGDVTGTRNASRSLFEIYKKTSRYSEALEMHELFITMSDSINSESSRNELLRQEFKYDYEKKVAADSVRLSEQKKVIALQFKQEETKRYTLYVGLIFLLVFGVFMFNRFKIAKKQKNIIEEQKLIVEIKQREILDSIHYAKKIQQSLLPNDNYINKHLNRLSKR